MTDTTDTSTPLKRFRLTEQEFAAYTGIPVEALREWRTTGKRRPGVEWIRKTRRGRDVIRYVVAKWDKYIAQQNEAAKQAA